jgi:hypothetical protein
MKDKRNTLGYFFRNSIPVFGQRVPATEAYPTVKSLTVTIEEFGKGTSSDKIQLGLSGIEWYRDCSNPSCKRGGYTLGKILFEMTHNHEVDKVLTNVFCPGDEGTPKGRRRGPLCRNSANITVHIEYKDEQGEPIGEGGETGP